MGSFQTMGASCTLAPVGSLGLELFVCLFSPELLLNHWEVMQQLQNRFECNCKILVVALNTIYTHSK